MPQGSKQGKQGQKGPQGKQGQKGQKQGQGQQYLADGTFTQRTFSKMDLLDDKLISNGVHPSAVSFMYYTSLPVGHPDHMNDSAAAKEFYPNLSVSTAKSRVFKAYNQTWRLLLFGNKIEHFQEIWATRHKKPEGTRKKRRIPIEEKAEQRTNKELRQAFRSQEGLCDRGKMADSVKEACDRYVKEHYAKAYEQTIKKMKVEIQERALETAGV